MAIKKMIQGDEIDFNITINETIVTSSTVIKFVMQAENTSVQAFEKSVGAGITKIDDDEYVVTLEKADTLTLSAGIYNIQSIVVDAGKERAISFSPNFIEIQKRLDFT
jgi:hypothetical protein